ncbi:MAG: hypothetical protein ACJ798_09070 [Phenylobacterium sp.]
MSDSWIDPGSLEGDALRQWYLRSPAEVERERREAAARRYQDFFYGGAGYDPDPQVGREAPTSSQDIDPGFAVPAPAGNIDPGFAMPAPSRDIDPGFTWVAAGPNRFRSVRSQTTPLRAPAAGPVYPSAPARVSPPAQTIAYGALRAPAPSDQELAELRRQQAAFSDTARKIDLQNSWLAVPALAPALVAMGLGAAGEWATGEIAPEAGQAVANFVDREAWQRGAQKAAQALSDAEKNALRAAGRAKFARANGISASDMQAEVHHSDPLEWAHLKPNADPNRLANLWGLRGEAHDIATRAWADFTRGLKGRIPTQAELMQPKLRIDRMVEPYLRHAGVPRSNTPPREGGPI